MTTAEKLKKAEQKVKRLEAQVRGMQRSGAYLKESYGKLEMIRGREREAMKAEADLLRTILECAVVKMLEGKEIEYQADPEKHVICITVKDKV